MYLTQQLLRQLFFVIVNLSLLWDVSSGIIVDGLVGGCDEMLGFIWNGCCCFGKAEIVAFGVFLVGLHEG